MELFQKLKQEIPGFEAAAGGDEAGWDAETSRGQLEGMLRRAQVELGSMQGRYDDLRSESEALRREHGEFRAKVQAWRQQSKVDREAANKIIVSLRGAEGSKEDAYSSGLKEQVQLLKERFRQSTEQFEKAEYEKQALESRWKQEFQDYNAKVELWKSKTERPSVSPSPGMGRSSSYIDDEVTENALKLIQAETEVEQLKANLTELEKKLTSETEKTEELIERTEADAEKLRGLVATHDKELAMVRSEFGAKLEKLQDTTQAKYIKDLEAELKGWRKGGHDSRLADDDGEGISRARGEAEAAVAKCREQDEIITGLRAELKSTKMRYTHLDVDADERETALEELYNENITLREALDTTQGQVREVNRDLGEVKAEADVLSSERGLMEERVSGMEASCAKLNKTNLNLQKELASRNETVRKLKLDLVRYKADGSQSEKQHHAMQPARRSHTPLPTTSSILPKWRVMRVYLAIAFILVFLTFSFYSTRSITQENELQEKLEQCLRASKKSK